MEELVVTRCSTRMLCHQDHEVIKIEVIYSLFGFTEPDTVDQTSFPACGIAWNYIRNTIKLCKRTVPNGYIWNAYIPALLPDCGNTSRLVSPSGRGLSHAEQIKGLIVTYFIWKHIINISTC
jgi:hypothetical protein